MGLLGLAIYRYAESREEQFRTRVLAYFKSFSLPWFAILGAHKALDHDLGIFAAIIIGLIATTAGGVFIDLFSGVTPEIVRPAQQLVTAALLASTVYTLIAVYEKDSTTFFPVTLVAVLVSFVFRVIGCAGPLGILCAARCARRRARRCEQHPALMACEVCLLLLFAVGLMGASHEHC